MIAGDGRARGGIRGITQFGASRQFEQPRFRR
jgi:hypothetical protein